MFKVHCPQCSAPYQVDERRVPPTGVNMRCPKCGQSFVVTRPDDMPALAEPRTGMTHSDASRLRPSDATTMLGVAAPVGAMRPRVSGASAAAAAGEGLPATRPRDLSLRKTMQGAASTPLGPLSVDLPGLPKAQRTAPVEPFALETPESAGGDDLPEAAVERPALPSVRPPAARPAVAPPRPYVPKPQAPPPRRKEEAISALSLGDFDLGPELPASLGGSVIPGPNFAQGTSPADDASETSELDSDLPAALLGLTSLRPASATSAAKALDSELPVPVGGLNSVLPISVGNRASLPVRSATPQPNELPLPQEPESDFADAQWSRDSVAPLSDGDLSSVPPSGGAATGERWASSDSDDGIELPSPAADFDKELARAFEPAEPSDFDNVFSRPLTDPPAPGLDAELSIQEVSSFEVPSVEALTESLPDLPDLETSSLPRGRVPSAPRARNAAADEDDVDQLDEDVFTLESVPPSQVLGSDRGRGSIPPTPARSGNAAGSAQRGGSSKEEGPRAGAFAGGTAYGELDLGVGDGMLDDGPGSGLEDAEFGAIPEEDPSKARQGGLGLEAEPPSVISGAKAAATAQVAPRSLGGDSAPRPVSTAQPRGRARLWIAGALGLGIAGGALALLPNVGPFGAYWLLDVVQASSHARDLGGTSARVAELKKGDTFSEVQPAIQLCNQARQNMPRYAPLAAYCALTHYSLVVRFGGLAEVQAAGRVLLDQIRKQDPAADLPYLREAQAAEGILGADPAGARRTLQQVPAPGIETLALQAELELRQKDPLAAKGLWERAHQNSPSAWTLFGIARSLLAAGDVAAEAKAKEVLAANAQHVGAKLLLLELAVRAKDEQAALSWSEQIEPQAPGASPAERVLWQTLLGEVHLTRGRLSRAEASFTQALQSDARFGRALIGLGQTHFRAGRVAAALAAYEAASSSSDAGAEAVLGVVQCQLSLELTEKARASLAPLLTSHAGQPAVTFWQGKLEAASGRKEEARHAYQRVLEQGGQAPIVVDAVVALAQSHGEVGQFDDAARVLVDAQKRFPTSVALRNALGQVALSQGRYDVALAEFQAAQKLDPNDLTALFNVGSALRRLKRFEEAWQAFDAVSKLDAELPGLPLERGLLLEQSGRAVEALKEYEAALAKAPHDLDLMLRVGCGRVGASDGKHAEQILEEVLNKRQRSAEAQHCLGRALFIQGRNLEALKRLQQAVDLDPQRAEYHLYVGWVANEAGQVAIAKRELIAALELDQGLAEAYWQRGVLNLRQGGPADAVIDFKRALELNPSRFEVHADLAHALDQLGKTREALEHWQKAITAYGDNPTWLFRYGKLLYNQHRGADAAVRLERAITLGEKLTTVPVWLWEAHHLAAASLGSSERALAHWRKFLQLSPQDSPYRTDAKRALRQAGQPWQGN